MIKKWAVKVREIREIVDVGVSPEVHSSDALALLECYDALKAERKKSKTLLRVARKQVKADGERIEKLEAYIKAEGELPMTYATKEAAEKAFELKRTLEDDHEAN